MKLQSKVAQEIEGNRWFEKNKKRLQSNKALTETQLKTILVDAITYYLIDAISFRMFIEIVDNVGERHEISSMPDLNAITTRLFSLSQFSPNPQGNKEFIIEVFYENISKLLDDQRYMLTQSTLF